MSESYGPHERIRAKKDFQRLYKRGRCFRGKYFTLITLPNGLDRPRMAAVTSRKVGCAVVRNRFRRRARELFRRSKDLIDRPLDILVIARPEAGGLGWSDMKTEYLKALEAVRRG